MEGVLEPITMMEGLSWNRSHCHTTDEHPIPKWVSLRDELREVVLKLTNKTLKKNISYFNSALPICEVLAPREHAY